MAKIRAKAKLVENVRSIADNTRTHSVVCDLPIASGGTDSGSTALELSLMALADCGVTIFADVCKNSNIDPGKIQVSVEAEKSPDSPVIHGVTMKVNVDSKARKELGWEPKIKFNELVKIMVKEDLERWERWQKGELFPWDAPNYPFEKNILTRALRL